MRKKTACSCGCKDFEKVDLTARNSNHSIFSFGAANVAKLSPAYTKPAFLY